MRREIAILLTLSIFTFLASCTPAVVQPVRVVGKNKVEIAIGNTLSMVKVDDTYSEEGYHYSLVIYPDIVLRYGFENGFDVGLRIWQIVGTLMDVRW